MRTLADAKHAIELGACRIINVKLGRVGGHGQAKRLEQVCRSKAAYPSGAAACWNPASGALTNDLATLTGFRITGDVSASARYWEEDIIEPAVTVSSRGTIAAPDKPGIGFEVNRARIDRLTVRRERIEG